MNAVTHGLTARVALLSDESPVEFEEGKSWWVSDLKPRNPVERAMAERAFYHSWQLKRVMRAQWARLSFRARTKSEDDRNRVEQEVAELALRLFKRPSGRSDALGAESDDAGCDASVNADPADHPARLVGRLEGTEAGCRWLIDRFSELEAVLERDQAWYAPERFRAYRLLRIRSSDAYFDAELTLFIQACQVLDPEAGSLVGEVWNEFVAATDLPALEESYQRAIRQRPAPDHAAARQHLLEVVRAEIERIAGKAQWHEERAEIETALSDHLLAFDDSKEAELLRRYESGCEKLMFRNLDELKKRQSEKVDRGVSTNFGFGGAAPYFGTRIDAQRLEAARRARQQSSHCTTEGSLRGSTDQEKASGMGAAAERAEPSRRNEANESEPSRADDAGGLRSEPNAKALPDSQSEVYVGVVASNLNDTGTASAPAVDRQPTLAMFVGHRRDPGHGSALAGARQGRKGRDRKRRNAERAAAAKARAEGSRK
jgi:hypothetical protein